MQWHDWNDDAFERARERNCPVLLFLRASWCPWCRELEQSSFADERVLSLLSDGFVCIRVDKDARPDLDTRFRKSGWPTLAWLDPQGELIASDDYLEPDALAERLEAVRAYHAGALETLAPSAEATAAPGPGRHATTPAPRRRHATTLSMELVDEVMQTLLDAADPVHGGWGTRHKFPHPDALHFAIVRWSQTGDRETMNLVLRTLRNMQEGEIYDRVEGGFYRYATHADWSVPHHEKMLDSNAQRLLAYVEAYQALGEASFRATAEGILDWLYGTLLDPATRAFRGSQDADPVYAHLPTAEARRRHGAPECDPTVFTNWNAMAVCSLLKTSLVLEDDRHRVQALATLDFLMENLWDRREGMYHYWDGTYNLPGLLTDQAYTLRALIEAMHYAGENRYLEPARALAAQTIEHLQAPDGRFYDARHTSGTQGLAVRNSSILENSVMAEALLRLSCMTRDRELAQHGRACLAAFLPDYKRYGHFVAGYGRAVDLLFHEPVHVTIVGARGADATHALRDAALRPYVASRIVQSVDPIEDTALLATCGLPAPGEGTARAYVHQGRTCYAETSRPERLAALMARTERSS